MEGQSIDPRAGASDWPHGLTSAIHTHIQSGASTATSKDLHAVGDNAYQLTQDSIDTKKYLSTKTHIKAFLYMKAMKMMF